MIITFVGHGSLYGCESLEKQLQRVVIKSIRREEYTCFYCGGYGDFDALCAKTCRFVKKQYKNCETVLITPYITDLQQEKIKHLLEAGLYDSCLYPPLERVPPRYAIRRRNEWMVDEADLIIAYVQHTHGGAYKTLEYARRKKKCIVNLAEEWEEK